MSPLRNIGSLFLMIVLASACSKKTENAHTDHEPAASPPANQPAAPHGGHTPAFGGLVLMDAHDHHAELVVDAKGGKHRVYVSDGARNPLPASTFDEVKLRIVRADASREELVLTNAGDTHWEVTGKPVPETGAKIALSYFKGGKSLYDTEFPVEYVLTGKMPDVPASAGQGSGHGGTVIATSGGHIELVVERSGKFQVWLLDANKQLRPIAGAKVTLKINVKAYPDVALEAKGDHFEGTGPEIKSGHASATVTAELGETRETAEIKLHLEGGGGHGH